MPTHWGDDGNNKTLRASKLQCADTNLHGPAWIIVGEKREKTVEDWEEVQMQNKFNLHTKMGAMEEKDGNLEDGWKKVNRK